MANYRPRFTSLHPLLILEPIYTSSKGVKTKNYPDPDMSNKSKSFNGTIRTYRGQERDINGLVSLEDIVTIETWYRPDITAETRIYNPRNGKTYEVITIPESANEKNQVLSFQARAIGGKA